MEVLNCCVFLYIHLKSSGHELDNRDQISFSNMDASRVLVNCWLEEWVLQYVPCVVMDPINIVIALSSVVCHHLPDFVSLVPLSQCKTFTSTNFESKCLLSEYWSTRVFCRLAVSKATNMPNSQMATSGTPQILETLLFNFIVIRQRMSPYLC
jgi:hypothetical protein